VALVNDDILLVDLAYAEDLSAAPNGDLDVVSGLNNVSAALLRRMLTIPGTLAHAPDYGAGLLSFQGAPMSLSQKQKMTQKIAEQLPLDPRVESVSSVGIQVTNDAPDKMILTVKVKLLGLGEQTITYTPFDGGAA